MRKDDHPPPVPFGKNNSPFILQEKVWSPEGKGGSGSVHEALINKAKTNPTIKKFYIFFITFLLIIKLTISYM